MPSLKTSDSISPQAPCNCKGRCVGPCTGYDTQEACPPLIVLATLAIALPPPINAGAH